MELHVFPIPIPPPTSLSTRFLWVYFIISLYTFAILILFVILLQVILDSAETKFLIYSANIFS